MYNSPDLIIVYHYAYICASEYMCKDENMFFLRLRDMQQCILQDTKYSCTNINVSMGEHGLPLHCICFYGYYQMRQCPPPLVTELEQCISDASKGPCKSRYPEYVHNSCVAKYLRQNFWNSLALSIGLVCETLLKNVAITVQGIHLIFVFVKVLN